MESIVNLLKRESVLSLFFFIIFLLFSFVVLKVYFASVSYTPSAVKGDLKEKINFFTPQSWGFFTRDAREEQLYVYEFDSNQQKWIEKRRVRNGNPLNAFGLKKDARLNSMELAYVKSRVLEREWLKIRGDINEFVGKIDTVEVKNMMIQPNYIGDFILELKEPVPWAWSRNDVLPTMPSKIVMVQIH